MKPLHQAKQIGDSFFSYFSQHCSILCACRTALLPILKITKQLKLSNLYTYDTVLFKLQLFSTANAFIVYMIGFVKPFWEAERRGEWGRRWPLGAGQPRRGFLRPRGQEPASQWDPELPATAVSMPLLQVPAFHIYIMWRKVNIQNNWTSGLKNLKLMKICCRPRGLPQTSPPMPLSTDRLVTLVWRITRERSMSFSSSTPWTLSTPSPSPPSARGLTTSRSSTALCWPCPLTLSTPTRPSWRHPSKLWCLWWQSEIQKLPPE